MNYQAQLAAAGVVDGVVSPDVDALLFGATAVYALLSKDASHMAARYTAVRVILC
jgi:hypothetical protein